MHATCVEAVRQGLPAVVFTEHVDFTPFRAGFLGTSYPEFGDFITDGILTAPPLDVDGYLECVQRCRAAHPDLEILTGIEVGQPHRHPDQVGALVSGGAFDRVLGSLHCLPDGAEFAEPWELFPRHPAAQVFTAYLEEIPRMVSGSGAFTAFAHIDYPVRSWPDDAIPFDPRDFQEQLRHALRALADGDRALEINTRLPLDPTILRWWVEKGGELVTFGSDAHKPDLVGTGLADAGELARSVGFGPAAHPGTAWALAAT